MKNPEVSVVMPAYNHEKFVGEAIESVLNQTFTDFEFVIINDGSKDGTEAVIRRYDDPRIKYYSQKNQGAHNAINKGISIAKGKYISIINSDDVYHPERLSFLLEQAESRDAVFIFTDLIFLSESHGYKENHSEWFENLKSIYNNSKSLEVTFLSGNIAVTTSNFFFLSSILKEIEPFQPYRYVHDYDFVLRVLLKYPDKFLYVSDKKYLSYRLHGANTIRESITAVHIEVLRLLLEKTHEFIQNESDRIRAKAALKYIKHMDEDIFRTMQQNNSYTQDILNTISWRLTEPLRRLGDFLLRIKSK
ncbi:MAG: glycosyltransferase [Deltaproteobacteria bacterium]